MPAAVPIGIDSFVELRQLGLEYVDKSFFIQQIAEDIGAKVLLLPRPRRFGKTLNLTMLETFFARTEQNRRELFRGLQIEGAGKELWKHFQRYPTVFITLKSLKPQFREGWQRDIAHKIGALFEDWLHVLDKSGRLNHLERERVQLLIERKAEP